MSDNEKSPEEQIEALKRENDRLRNDVKDLRASNTTLEASNKALEAEAEANDADKWRERAVKGDVRAALAAEGIKDAARVSKFMSLEGVGYDDDGNLSGFADALKQAKADLPELFEAKRRAGGTADIFADNPAGEKLTTTEQQIARLRGQL